MQLFQNLHNETCPYAHRQIMRCLASRLQRGQYLRAITLLGRLFRNCQLLLGSDFFRTFGGFDLLTQERDFLCQSP